jgi:hypothetical protein
MFKTNAGTVDRAMRIVFGLLIVSLAFVGPQTAWGWLGLIPIATGLMGWCPLYSVLGMNTCEAKSST